MSTNYTKPNCVELNVQVEAASCQRTLCKYEDGVHYEPYNNHYFQAGSNICMELPITDL